MSGPIAALGSALPLAYRQDMSRVLRAVRLAFEPLTTVFRGETNRPEEDKKYAERAVYRKGNRRHQGVLRLRQVAEHAVDGGHKGTGISPHIVEVAEDKTVAVCGCAKSAGMPFCDGAHKNSW